MPTTPRLLLKKLTVTQSDTMRKKIEAAVLDTRPNSPLRPRLASILQTRKNVATVTTTKYFTGMLRAVGDILDQPGMDAFSEDVSGPQRRSRPHRVYIRDTPVLNLPVEQILRSSSAVTSAQAGASAAGSRLYVRKVGGEKTVPVTTLSRQVANSRNLSKRTLQRLPPFERLTLESGNTRPMAWKGLSPNYMYARGMWQGYPRSVTFWRKTGELSRRYDLWWAKHYTRLATPANYSQMSEDAVQYPTNVKGSRPRLARLSFTLRTPLLRMGVAVGAERVLGASFATGTAQSIPTPRYVRRKKKQLIDGHWVRTSVFEAIVDSRGLNRMLLPETSRPMLARYAAAVGRRHREALRKVLKP